MGIDFSQFSSEFKAKYEEALKESSDGGKKITKKEFEKFSPADQKKLTALIAGDKHALGDVELDKDIDIKMYQNKDAETTQTLALYGDRKASEGLLDLTPDTISRYPDAYMGYLKSGVITLYDKQGNAIKDKNGNKVTFNFGTEKTKSSLASWYMEHNGGKFDLKTMTAMQELDQRLDEMEEVDADVYELMNEIDLAELKSASEDTKASFFERLDAKAAYKKAQAQAMMKQAAAAYQDAVANGEWQDEVLAVLQGFGPAFNLMDNTAGITKFREFVKDINIVKLAEKLTSSDKLIDYISESVDDGDDKNYTAAEKLALGVVVLQSMVESIGGINAIADAMTEAADDGDDSHLSTAENVVENIKGAGRGLESFIGTQGIVMMGSIVGATEGATAIAVKAIGESANAAKISLAIGQAVTAYFAYEGADLMYEGIKEAITAETKEQAGVAGEKLGMGAFMATGGLKLGAKGYKKGVRKVREAHIEQLRAKYREMEPEALLEELGNSPKIHNKIAITDALIEKGYSCIEKPVVENGKIKTTQTVVYSPEGKLIELKSTEGETAAAEAPDLNNLATDLKARAEANGWTIRNSEWSDGSGIDRSFIYDGKRNVGTIYYNKDGSVSEIIEYKIQPEGHAVQTITSKEGTEIVTKGLHSLDNGPIHLCPTVEDGIIIDMDYYDFSSNARDAATRRLVQDGNNVKETKYTYDNAGQHTGTEEIVHENTTILDIVAKEDPKAVNFMRNQKLVRTADANKALETAKASETKGQTQIDDAEIDKIFDEAIAEAKAEANSSGLPSVEQVKAMDIAQLRELAKTPEGLNRIIESGVAKASLEDTAVETVNGKLVHKQVKTADGQVISSSLEVTRLNGTSMDILEGIPQEKLQAPVQSFVHQTDASTINENVGIIITQNQSKPVIARKITLDGTLENSLVENNTNNIPLKYDNSTNTPYADTPWNPGRQNITGNCLQVTYGMLEEGWGARPEYMAEYADPVTGKAPDVGTLAAQKGTVDRSFMPADIAGKQYEIIDPVTGERIPCNYEDMKPGVDYQISKKAGVELKMAVPPKAVKSSEGETLPAGKLYMVDSNGHFYNGNPIKRIKSGEVNWEADMSDPVQAQIKHHIDESLRLESEAKAAKKEVGALEGQAEELRNQANAEYKPSNLQDVRAHKEKVARLNEKAVELETQAKQKRAEADELNAKAKEETAKAEQAMTEWVKDAQNPNGESFFEESASAEPAPAQPSPTEPAPAEPVRTADTNKASEKAKSSETKGQTQIDDAEIDRIFDEAIAEAKAEAKAEAALTEPTPAETAQASSGHSTSGNVYGSVIPLPSSRLIGDLTSKFNSAVDAMSKLAKKVQTTLSQAKEAPKQQADSYSLKTDPNVAALSEKGIVITSSKTGISIHNISIPSNVRFRYDGVEYIATTGRQFPYEEADVVSALLDMTDGKTPPHGIKFYKANETHISHDGIVGDEIKNPYEGPKSVKSDINYSNLSAEQASKIDLLGSYGVKVEFKVNNEYQGHDFATEIRFIQDGQVTTVSGHFERHIRGGMSSKFDEVIDAKLNEVRNHKPSSQTGTPESGNRITFGLEDAEIVDNPQAAKPTPVKPAPAEPAAAKAAPAPAEPVVDAQLAKNGVEIMWVKDALSTDKHEWPAIVDFKFKGNTYQVRVDDLDVTPFELKQKLMDATDGKETDLKFTIQHKDGSVVYKPVKNPFLDT